MSDEQDSCPIDFSFLPSPANGRWLTAHCSLLTIRSYFSFGGSVNPNTEIIPVPATFTLLSPGVGRYSALQFSQRYTSAFGPQAFSTSPHSRSTTSVL